MTLLETQPRRVPAAEFAKAYLAVSGTSAARTSE